MMQLNGAQLMVRLLERQVHEDVVAREAAQHVAAAIQRYREALANELLEVGALVLADHGGV